MTTNLKITIDYRDLIDVLNFLDQKNIETRFNEEKLFSDLILKKNFDEIEFFLDRGTKAEDFIKYCDDDDNDVINFLIEKNDDTFENPGIMLTNLIYTNNFRCAELLLEKYKGDMKEFVNYDNGKPLKLATLKGNEQLVKLLLIYGAKIKKCIVDPIVDALEYQHMNLVPVLIAAGSKVKSVLPEHLELYMKHGRDLSISYILSALLKNEMDHFDCADLTNCLLVSAKYGYVGVFRELLYRQDTIPKEFYRRLMNCTNDKLIMQSLMFFKLKKKKDKQKNKQKYDSNESDSDDKSNSNSETDSEEEHFSRKTYRPIKINRGGVHFKD